VEGELAAGERSALEMHVASCDECRLLVAELARAMAPADEEEDTFSTLRPALRIGRFVVTEVLGEGGMGVVYAAKDPVLRRKVAVKLLRPDLESVWGQNAPERLLREAQATARLSHPNVVTIYDAGTHDGRVFIAMELVDGISAREWTDKVEHDWLETARVYAAAGRGLAAVHEAGFVHRDFKPDNILIGRNGRPRVTDFGFVRFGKADGDDEESSVRFEGGTLTIPGQVLGTPAYMAPEQIVGDEATAASDQFSFCVALWEALFQRRPFRGTNMAELRKQMLSGQLERPSPRSVVPATVTAVLERGLATMPEDRYPSMAALLEQLEPLLAESGPGPAEEASPYPGLVAFTEDDSDRFFGRDHEITQALGRLHDNAFVAVVGPAGAGKSSLVRAGIIPSLVNSGQSWEIFPIRPGRHPLAELARLLLPLTTGPMDPAAQAKDSGEMIELLGSSPQVFGATLRRRARHYGVSVLIFIDQLEELYTLASAAEREAFVACITQLDDGSHSPLRVIGSIRSDLVDRVGEDRGLLDRLSRGMMFVGPPDGLSLKEALVRPLEIVGYRFEDARLADDIVAELEGRAAALPLLQFAATRLWQGRDRERRLIPRTSYQAMGTVTGALSAHAEQIVAALGADKRALLKAVVTRLVTPDRSADVARIDELHELGATPHEVELLVDSLVDASLLVKRAGESGATVELAHEALIDEAWS
ncbi:MAG: protein kinase, partial [Deltaproteobacteria bacterium]|nr:protein kinase [Deltaproteobacteria bacterium]